MQTRLNIIGTALLGIAGYYAYLNYHYILTGAVFIGGIALVVIAATKKDKKDKQIEEIHSIATKKEVPLQIQLPPLQEDILKYLYEKDYVSQVLLNLALHAERETVTVNLEALEVNRMVSGQKLNKKLDIPDWRIERRGNDYLINKGIIKK